MYNAEGNEQHIRILSNLLEHQQPHQHLHLRERRQSGFATRNGNLAVSGWVGLAYDR